MRAPPTLDYEPPSPPAAEPWDGGDYALGLSACAVAMDCVAFAAGQSRGGYGWVTAFPCLCLNGLAAPVVAAASVALAIAAFRSQRVRRWRPWAALALDAAAVVGAVILYRWSFEAIASA